MRKYSLHGMRRTRTYTIWSSMMARCLNPNSEAFPSYGGRGITVCERWTEFTAFFEDMGTAPRDRSIDRIDNDKGYSPDNCRWATRSEQNRNRRNVRLLTVDGETASMVEWSERHGVALKTIWLRIKKGWPVDRAVKTPVVTDRKGKPRGHSWSAQNGLIIEHFDAANDDQARAA